MSRGSGGSALRSIACGCEQACRAPDLSSSTRRDLRGGRGDEDYRREAAGRHGATGRSGPCRHAWTADRPSLVTHLPTHSIDAEPARLRRKRASRGRIPGPRERALSRAEKLRYGVEYAGFVVAERSLRMLGLERAAALSGMLWRHASVLSGRHRRACDQLAQAFPDKTDAERRGIVEEMWDNLGRTFAEGFFLEELLGDPTRLEVDAEAEALSRAGAVVYATLHSGNWEVAAAASTRIGCAVAGVYQKLKNPYVEERILAMRDPLYVGGLHEKGGNLVPKLVAWVRAGHPVGIVSDQRDARGMEVPFFGRPAASTPFPAYLARKCGIPLLAIRVVRLPRSRFRIEMTQIEVPQTADRLDDMRAATASLQATFEAWIRDRPGQWMWAHRRWG